MGKVICLDTYRRLRKQSTSIGHSIHLSEQITLSNEIFLHRSIMEQLQEDEKQNYRQED